MTENDPILAASKALDSPHVATNPMLLSTVAKMLSDHLAENQRILQKKSKEIRDNPGKYKNSMNEYKIIKNDIETLTTI